MLLLLLALSPATPFGALYKVLRNHVSDLSRRILNQV